jgi:uracil-DNA glycosylase
MSLKESAMKIKTNWREVIINLLDSNPTIEDCYKKQCMIYGEHLPIYPEKENIFRCFDYFNVEETAVVLLGQDPYHGPNQATGLCFGVETSQKLPPSLRNIMKKLTDPLCDSTLEHWAQQGVLMLNSSLTVRHKSPGSHMKIWKKFTDSIIEHVSKYTKEVVFVAWGAFALKKYSEIRPRNYGNGHSLLVCSHPSPLSVSRNLKLYPSFKEFNTFLNINIILGEKRAIIW